MQLTALVDDLAASLASIEDVGSFGINANTFKKDERAWQMWEFVCERKGTSPLRSHADVRDYPQRSAHLLACLMLHAFATCKPSTPGAVFIKPRSALAYPLAIVRVFGRWGVKMPAYKALVAELNGLMRLYLMYHGPYSLMPKRRNPCGGEW